MRGRLKIPHPGQEFLGEAWREGPLVRVSALKAKLMLQNFCAAELLRLVLPRAIICTMSAKHVVRGLRTLGLGMAT